MPLIYRAMLRDGEKPQIGSEGKMLGVRTPPHRHADVKPDEESMVEPGRGMSVAPHWRDLPYFLIPRRLQHLVPKAKGINNAYCWRMGDGSFEDAVMTEELALRVDSKTHEVVEPTKQMQIDAFQAALAATKDDWEIDEEG